MALSIFPLHRRLLLRTAVLSLVLVVVSACRGADGTLGVEGPAGPAGPVGPRLTGSMVGFASLFDEVGTRLPDNAGMTVTVDGTNPAVTATTDAAGRYELRNLPTGTYDLTLTRAGHNPFRRMSVQHTGGDTPSFLGNNNLWQASTTVVTDLAATVSGTTISITGRATPVMPTGTPAALQRRVRVFFGTSATVSATTYQSTFNQFLVPAGGDGSFTFNLTTANFARFRTGDRVHIVAHGISPLENTFVDVLTNRTIYSAINLTPSNVVSVVLP